MASKNAFSVDGNTVTINREGWDSLAFATYREDYYPEMTRYTWSIVNGYPSNATLGGGLHRYMVAKWYGQDLLDDLTAKGYVVDHMNNNHMDCRISNLEFLKHNRNVAKGMYLDKESKELEHRIALSLFKDFDTGCYQVTIGCNDAIVTKDDNGNEHYINSIKLLYDCEYSLVILDVESILTQYSECNSFSLNGLRYCDKRITEAHVLDLAEEEKDQAFVIRDGVPYLVIGNGKSFISSVHYDEGWLPPNKKD